MLSKELIYYVYALIDPINRLPFYIGKGKGHRAYSHLKNEKTNTKKVKTIQNIRALGLEPDVRFLIENVDEKTAYNIEYDCIKIAKKIYGINITNKSGLVIPPSRKGCKLSEKTKLKISNSTKGKTKLPMSKETKQKLSSINKNKVGPNKIILNNNLLEELYTVKNYTKKQICVYFGIGMGSLNRILKENSIKKPINCFALYGHSGHINR
jgi:hypothetical protein